MTDSTLSVLAPVTSLFPVDALPGGLSFGDRTPGQVLGGVYFTDYELFSAGDGVGFAMTVIVTEAISMDVPGLDGTTLVLGAPPDGEITQFRLSGFAGEDGFEVSADELRIALRFPPSLLTPVPANPGDTPPPFAEIAVQGSVAIDQNLDVRVRGFDRLSLPPVMVGTTGVVISADDVLLSLSKAGTPREIIAAGFDEGFLGVFIGQATIKLPEGLPELAPAALTLHNAAIGSEGVSGRLDATYDVAYDPVGKRFTGDGAGELFGVPFGVGTLGVELRRNALIAGGLTGQVLLPFFDVPLRVTVTIRGDGSAAVALGAGTALGTFERAGLVRLVVSTLGFEVSGGELVAHTGGTVTPLIGDAPWPSFQAGDVSIDSGGHIAVHGGGLVLTNGQPLALVPALTGTGLVPGISVDRLALSGDPAGDGLAADAQVSTVARLGPVTANVQKVGVRARIDVAPSSTHPVAGDLSFTPPDGVGLTVDAQGVVTGGGFLFHDAATGLYGGALQLALHERIVVSAYGLVTNTLPDGGKGFSLLVFITAEGFKPIPLGFGFMLQGIGGILGVHRTFDQGVLESGLKTDALAKMLFPHDPVGNAAAVVQALAAAFPGKRGSLLLGLLAHITWFTPTLVDMDLALVLELGARERLLVLGRVSALLPSKDDDLVRLNIDAMGVLDFDAGTLEADAVLVDSRLAHKFPVTGSGALRARWSGDKNFVLAAGGLNPHFTPPSGFPKLEPVSIALCTGDNPRLVCEAYLAITANTVQFGATASLHAEALSCTVTGNLGFDALITLLPPHFLIDFHTDVAVSFHGHHLAKVSLDGNLEGPLPLKLAAKATFEILWVSFSVPFRYTLSPGSAGPFVSTVDLAGEIATALAAAANWSTRPPAGPGHGVALRGVPTGATTALDPLGQLVVRQQVAPLNTGRDVDTYGGAAVAGARRFRLTGTLNDQAGTPSTADFAPARYFTMSDDDKLAAPSFETMDDGLVLGSDAVTFAPAEMVAGPLRYEAITVNPAGVADAPDAPPYELPAGSLAAQAATGAAARVPVRGTGRARFRTPVTAPAATLSDPAWRIIRIEDGSAAPVDPAVTTWSEQRAALADLNRGGRQWEMVAAHELVS